MSEHAIAALQSWGEGQEDQRTAEESDLEPRFVLLYQRTYPAVLGYLRLLVGAPEVAEDLTAQAFEQALRHFDAVRAPASATAWLFQIARHCAADYFRRTKPTVSLERLGQWDHPQAQAVEEQTLAREEQCLLLEQVGRLSEREREVIGLKFVAHLSNREIAHILQMPQGTVGSMLYRTLRRLRAALEEKGATP